ncbi:MAG: response regulator, partial [Pirellulales bacterium]|nr:response regulator [Pirellulales bacterium]
RAEAGMIHLQCEPVTLSELIDQCVAMVHPKAAQAGVEVRPHVDPDVTDIMADPLRLKQIVFTLLSNAVDFNKEGGVVNMQIRLQGPTVLISVRDTGKGISANKMEMLFDPYHEDLQDHDQMVASLGLSLTKCLVEMHGGSLKVESVVDSGTVFTVALPKEGPARAPLPTAQPSERLDREFEPPVLAATASRPISPPESKATSRDLLEADQDPDATTRVLVADGNASVRRILRQWLTSLGFETIEADNGPTALEVAHGRPAPHVILLDAKLSGMSGYETCRALKGDTRLQMIPIILCTTLDNTAEKTRAFDAGADDFLVKPISRADLIVRLRSLLRIYQFNQELIGAESVAMALAKAVAAKDGYSQNHVAKTAQYAVMLGEKLGLDVAELKSLKYGAILHNVGKISIPDAILEKKGSLTPREMAMFQQHPQIGCDICSSLKPLKPVLTIIRHHKERWDGSGYPDRLQGTEIPLDAQIVGIVDAYTALISNRPYRKAMTHGEAIAVLRRQTLDGWYNPDLFERFVECLRETEDSAVLDEVESPVALETS